MSESSDEPKILYHYCSLSSLVGIVESKSLRMSNAYWLNDRSEMRTLGDDVRELIGAIEPATPYLWGLQQKLSQDGVSDVYCFCLSEQPDLLSQWIGYADAGHGFAIGFDRRVLDGQPSVQLTKVIYDHAKRREMASEIVETIRRKNDQIGDFNDSERLEKEIEESLFHIWWDSIHFKNEHFQSEQEWRIVERGSTLVSVKYRIRENRELIPFKEFGLFPKDNPIREVWLGPRNHNERNRLAIAHLLEWNGFSVPTTSFHVSDVPLR